MNKKTLLLMGIAVLLLSSCVVSKKKYEIAESGRIAALFSRDSLAELLGVSRYDCSMFNDRVNALMTDTALLKGSIRNYQALLASGQNENQKLSANLMEREKTIVELQKMIAEQNQKVKNLLKSVKDALLGFSSDELTVREEGGKVYVAMSDKLLFESVLSYSATGRNPWSFQILILPNPQDSGRRGVHRGGLAPGASRVA